MCAAVAGLTPTITRGYAGDPIFCYFEFYRTAIVDFIKSNTFAEAPQACPVFENGY